MLAHLDVAQSLKQLAAIHGGAAEACELVPDDVRIVRARRPVVRERFFIIARGEGACIVSLVNYANGIDGAVRWIQ